MSALVRQLAAAAVAGAAVLVLFGAAGAAAARPDGHELVWGTGDAPRLVAR